MFHLLSQPSTKSVLFTAADRDDTSTFRYYTLRRGDHDPLEGCIRGEKKIRCSISADYTLSEMKGWKDGEEREREKPVQFSQTS